METLEEKVTRVTKEEVSVMACDPRWPELFEKERLHLLSCLPADLVEKIEHWDRLLFRDYLIEHPDVAGEYGNLKMTLSDAHHSNRVACTQAKSGFIRRVTEKAKQYYRKAQQAHVK
jgi:GrpB-like predicted nucleotidyltransferase (UPF0157 family)